MANDDRDDNNNLSPFRDGAPGNLQGTWPASVRTAEQSIAEQQAKFDALQTRNEGSVTVTEGQGNE